MLVYLRCPQVQQGSILEGELVNTIFVKDDLADRMRAWRCLDADIMQGYHTDVQTTN